MVRILVIDDNDQFREMLCDVLKREGYEIVMARDGKEGTDLYRKEPTDLVITDVNMPEKSGQEVIFELQRDFPDVKIIAISGGLDESEGYLKDIAAFSDVKHIFTKPFDIDELLQVVKELLNQ